MTGSEFIQRGQRYAKGDAPMNFVGGTCGGCASPAIRMPQGIMADRPAGIRPTALHVISLRQAEKHEIRYFARGLSGES